MSYNFTCTFSCKSIKDSQLDGVLYNAFPLPYKHQFSGERPWPRGPYCPILAQVVILFSLVGFVALRPKSTAMVIAGRSVHLTTLFSGQA